MIYFNHKLLAAVLFILAMVLGACTLPVQSGRQVDIAFVSHLAAGLVEQDVYIETPADAQEVQRMTSAEVKRYQAAPLYASSALVEHDVFSVGPTPIGPFPKGADLGMTLGEWLSARGSGTYTVINRQATIDLQFENLIPSGVYTLWCSRVTGPPNVLIIDKPCGAPDGSQNTFIADATGKAQFNLTLSALEDSSAQTSTVIAIAYHSDGQTHGASPGDFGLNSHVQIFGMLPAPQDAAWRTVTADAVAMGK